MFYRIFSGAFSYQERLHEPRPGFMAGASVSVHGSTAWSAPLMYSGVYPGAVYMGGVYRVVYTGAVKGRFWPFGSGKRRKSGVKGGKSGVNVGRGVKSGAER